MVTHGALLATGETRFAPTHFYWCALVEIFRIHKFVCILKLRVLAETHNSFIIGSVSVDDFFGITCLEAVLQNTYISFK